MDAVTGPIITAPSLRTTQKAEQMVSWLKGDLSQVSAAAAQWVRQTAQRELDNQIRLGNSKQYTSLVDGSRAKPISEADRKVQVFFVTAILARQLGRAKPVLVDAIRRSTRMHTGLLANGWGWYIQRGGKGTPATRVGVELPPDLSLRPGDALILAPTAAYAWFANYRVARHEGFVPTEVKRQRKTGHTRRKPPRGFGFMAYAARQLRPELKRIGISVWPVFSTALEPPGTRAKFGVPILVFVVSSRLTSAPGLH